MWNLTVPTEMTALAPTVGTALQTVTLLLEIAREASSQLLAGEAGSLMTEIAKSFLPWEPILWLGDLLSANCKRTKNSQ